MIRIATIDDAINMAALGEIFYNGTILKNYVPYDHYSVKYLIEEFIKSDTCLALVLENDSLIVGGFLGTIVPLYWNRSFLAAQQIAWFVHPEYRSISAIRLLDTFEKWAKEQGATVIFSGAKKDAVFDGMNRILTRRGYTELESMHMKEV